MKRNSVIFAAMLMMIVLLGMMLMTACSSDHDDDKVAVNPMMIIGDWEASHHSKNPKYGDTADMWPFTFNPDGTGSGPFFTTSFRYEIHGNRITLNLMNTESIFDGQTIFIYEIVSISKDRMEWDELTKDHVHDNSMYLKFYRK